MMRGRLYIDGNDAYLQYGVYVVDGGWNSLIEMPPLKSVPTNDWQEKDGIEADLSNPVLNSREVSISFAFTGAYNRYFSLIELLSDGAYHEFNCAYIGRNFTLRLVSQSSLDYVTQLSKTVLKFADDFPLNGYEYAAPVSTVLEADDYDIDGVHFTDYGVRILQGTLTEVIKSSEVKKNLLRNIPTQTGATYDDARVTYKSKDVKINCLMRAETLTELWRNYDALLFDLIRPDEHLLWVNDIEQEFPCYYKSCSVSEFYPCDKIWLKFTLTLTVTDGLRITEDDVVLASEDNIVIFTENNVYAIEMSLNRY